MQIIDYQYNKYNYLYFLDYFLNTFLKFPKLTGEIIQIKFHFLYILLNF